MERNKFNLRIKLQSYLKQLSDGVVSNWNEFAANEGLKWESFAQASIWSR